MRFASAALLVLLPIGGAWAQQPLPAVPDLLVAEAAATRGCEGSGDPATVRAQCTLRDRLSGRLAQAGWCWGRKGQAEAKREWHPCGPDSLYADDLAPVAR